MRAWAVPWALMLISCISDLRPEVGALISDEVDAGQNSIKADAGKPDDSKPGKEVDGGAQDTDGKDGGETVVDVVDSGMAVDPAPGCKIKDSNPAQTVSFKDDIWPILSGCSCHDPKSDDPRGVDEVSLIIDSYVSLREGGINTKSDIVIAGNACDSIILQKLNGTASFGQQMPLDGPYLSIETRTLISDWIVEGARDN